MLQVIGDTDPCEAHLAAVALHRDLAGLGVEVRTLALAPGRRGGLDDLVPVMAPTRRSWTIRRVLDRERRWADVVVLHGPRAVVRRSRGATGGPPVVAVLAAHELGAGVPSGLDRVVVVAAPGTDASAADPGVTRLAEPVDAATWRDLFAGCAARCD